MSDAAWATLAELGMTALPVPEEQGGFNGSAVDMMVVMNELGRGIVVEPVEPYFATALGVQFLKLAGGHEDLLEQVAGGQLKLAAALNEKQSRHELFDIETTAKPDSGGYILNGTKTVVVHGAQAGRLISYRPAPAEVRATSTAFRCSWRRSMPAAQLHGGMGVTDELPAAHHFKRLTMIEVTLGDTDHHLARFAAQPGFREAA